MELTPLRYFVAIARSGRLTLAARELGVGQPALSAALKKLEADVGAPLLDRTGRGVELTEAGRVFLEHAREAVRSADEAARAVRELEGLERGVIRVGGGATAVGSILPPVVSAVRRAHPGLRFYVREAGSAAVASAVVAGELDLAVVTRPIAIAGRGELLETPLAVDELRLIVPPDHRLAGRRTFRWSELDGEPLVAFEAGSAVRTVIDAAVERAGVRLDVAMELRSIGSIRRMVAAGVGVGFVSRFALEEGAAGGERESGTGLGCRDGRLTRELAVVRRGDRVPSAAAAAFERVLLAGRRGGHRAR